jgi:hypothetical protein
MGAAKLVHSEAVSNAGGLGAEPAESAEPAEPPSWTGRSGGPSC